ncbi:glutamine--fructose-6-phosphate transaminase (isomerizing) [Hyphomonas pacifica]|uniref:glutamine--fructose-6-phosphate transaminase (isomerizing) n=1 Tax=Hyphomonas pacifica TaxID=1280941 RepID=UPI000C9829B7|nr:glutamine--fructose-6-phosphate transaminase (isomerizing) [Hyphomonas pacifica]MAN45838.1 glutamine--fructose-6-phosphate transaminase (isomerizing) [Hyphomonas sp.]MBR9806048.1 glutamine--fructose-6-phosphate transaminase (isomerizing) [Alphaproteobacteria bacterium]RAN32898.1 glucosamine--fructose-6-phosphate aminotransferase [Hyphomonas pacifica]|tara:strand:- start:4662 stop:6488 length:1827 start_codon:yes stop_codon:yes gene_type:complete
MCGIVAIAGKEPVPSRLVDGLKRLEYRGYDSAGIAVIDHESLKRRRAKGKIVNLEAAITEEPVEGLTGIAHTRWATHGQPNEVNAHPHVSGNVAIVHNGIIENFRELRENLQAKGRTFESETDSEVIAQLIAQNMDDGMDAVDAFEAALKELSGAFAIAAIFSDDPDLLMGARKGSPLVLGYGTGEMYLGSDAIALAPLTRDVTYLEEGDWVVLTRDTTDIRNAQGERVNRPRVKSAVNDALIERGEYDHFMLKEIHEQPESLARSILPYIDQAAQTLNLDEVADKMFTRADRAVAIACGTAYYAAHTAKYWFEQKARLAFETDIASEFRYREPVLPQTGPAMFVSQSGETADTLAALRYCRQNGTPAVAVVNVPESSIAREAEAIVPTHAGPEIGVASTKAFTAQLSVLAVLALSAAKARGHLLPGDEVNAVKTLLALPRKVTEALKSQDQIREIAQTLTQSKDVLFLGRGRYYPLALEGALKLKEVSYIHAEGYAAGELKHGPIALIEKDLPVVVVAPKDELFEKTISNVEEIRARGARVILISDEAGIKMAGNRADHVIAIPEGDDISLPILAAVPLQLLAYYVAVAKGTDVDQPRNLAKSVTVE